MENVSGYYSYYYLYYTYTSSKCKPHVHNAISQMSTKMKKFEKHTPGYAASKSSKFL